MSENWFKLFDNKVFKEAADNQANSMYGALWIESLDDVNGYQIIQYTNQTY